MKTQELFNRIWNHFMVREQPLSHVCGTPQYRGEDGAKCTVGILIPDELYKPAMEGLAVDTVLARWPMVAEHILGTDFIGEEIGLLLEMQGVHDTAVWIGDGPAINDLDNECRLQMLEIARKYNLCCPTH